MKTFATILASILCFTMHSTFAQKKKESKPMDGKTFAVSLTEEAKAKPTKPMAEVLQFKSEKLEAELMNDKYGFKKGTYTATIDSSNAEEPVITFDAEMKNDAGDQLIWHGTLTGEDIEGSAIWSKKGKTKKTYAFNGSMKKKK